MWRCSNCKEEVEDNFEVCWNCQTGRDGTRQVISQLDEHPNVTASVVVPGISRPASKRKSPINKVTIAGAILLLLAIILVPKMLREVSERQRFAASLSPGSSNNSSGLTKERLEKALSKWINSINSSGSARVVGIQESNNSASADLQFNNFTFKVRGFGGAGVEERVFSGGGLATLVKYNDGRWVLSTVYTNQGYDSRWFEGIGIVLE